MVFRLVAVSEGTHQHEVEVRGDDGSTQPLVAKVDYVTGAVTLVLDDVEREIRELIED